MNRILLLLILSFIFSNCIAQTDYAAGSELLFKKVKSKATPQERKEIFMQSGLRLSKDKNQFIAASDGKSEFPFDAVVFPTDLNKDGIEEICILYGNTYTSGSTGSDVLLFVKDASGRYHKNLGGPGSLPIVLPTNNKGYPDLVIGGPGMQFPVYRWDGKKYNISRQISDTDLQKMKAKGIDELSKGYTATL
jgi:hypothetical protein